MRYENEVFENREVVLDGNEFVNCTFRRAVLVLEGTGSISFNGGSLDAATCRWEARGAAETTINVLRGLFEQGGYFRDMVINTIADGQHQRDGPRIFGYCPIEWDFDKPLYKYLRAEHAELLLSEGALRVGTLYEYRDIETHGIEVGDDEEGYRYVYSDDPYIDWRQPETVPDMVRKRIVAPPGANIWILNSTFAERKVNPDCYVYSVSEEYDPACMRELGYDACIRIDDPRAFFHALATVLARDHGMRRHKVARCIYMDKREHYSRETDVLPALAKARRYAHQKEVRALWLTPTQKLTPLILQCPAASQFCRLLVICSVP
jgi:hypothetical protein